MWPWRRLECRNMDGIINIYKEAGYTSSDVVAKLRGILRQKKIGHTGTLDPAAEGVLPICLGKGTKLVDMLTEERKTYRAVLLLGRETDTQDTTGTTLRETDFTVFLGETGQTTETFARKLTETAAGYVGDYMQIPPMYSALKVNGKRLYELARKGVEVERKPRLQHIFRIEIDRLDLPRAEITVECSRGTYIRTLCHDIGRDLGCGGCMEHLLRTQVGPFLLEDSLKIADVERFRDEGRLSEILIPADRILSDIPEFHSGDPGLDRLLKNGNPFPEEYLKPADVPAGESPESGAVPAEESGAAAAGEEAPGPSVRVYDTEGRFIGVYRYQKSRHLWKAERIFI